MSDINSGDFDSEETSGAIDHENNDLVIDDEISDQVEEVAEQQTDFNKEERRLHLQALDLIGSVLDENYTGDRNKFFQENPELADKANKSKKYKELYRSLSEDEESYEEPVVEKKSKKAQPFASSEDDIVQKAALKVYKMNLDSERMSQTESFAEKEGMNIDDVDSLHASAKALYEANSGDIAFSKCLRAAKSALVTDGASPSVKIPNLVGSKDSASKPDANDGTTGQWHTV